MKFFVRFITLLVSSFMLLACGGGGGGGGDSNASIPIASAGQPQAVSVGSVVTLNASASSDPGQSALRYVWTLVSLPTGSTAALINPHTVTPTFTADLAGNYVASLIVNNGVHDSAAATVTITATSQTSGPLLSSLDTSQGTSKALDWPYTQTRQLVVLTGNDTPTDCNGGTILDPNAPDCPGSLEFSLSATDQSYTITNLQVEKTDNALTRTPRNSFSFSNLANGQKLIQGETLNFSASFALSQSGLSDDELTTLLQQTEVVYSFSIQETGQTFRQVLRFTKPTQPIRLQLYSYNKENNDAKFLPWPYDQVFQPEYNHRQPGDVECKGFTSDGRSTSCYGFLAFRLHALDRTYTIINPKVETGTFFTDDIDRKPIFKFLGKSENLAEISIPKGEALEFLVEYTVSNYMHMTSTDFVYSFAIKETGERFRQVVRFTQ